MEKLSAVGWGKNLSNQRALPPRALSDQMQARLSSSLPPQHFIYAPVVGLPYRLSAQDCTLPGSWGLLARRGCFPLPLAYQCLVLGLAQRWPGRVFVQWMKIIHQWWKLLKCQPCSLSRRDYHPLTCTLSSEQNQAHGLQLRLPHTCTEHYHPGKRAEVATAAR